MRIDPQYNQIPDDSFAAIQTQGLLGGKYIGLSPGGSDTYLKNGSHIDQTQSAIVLESLINKFFANFAQQGQRAARSATAPAGHSEQIGVEEMRYATLLATAAALHRRAAPRSAQAPAAPAAAATAQRAHRSGADRRPGHAHGARHEPRRLPQGSRQGRAARRQVPAAALRHRVSRRAWCWASTGAPRRRSSASASSMRSITRCSTTTARAGRLHVRPAEDLPDQVGSRTPTRATVRTEVKREQRRPRLGELLHAQDARGLEGVGCHHRRHQLRQELPRGLRSADRSSRASMR